MSAGITQTYSLHHVRAEMRRLDILIRDAVARFRRRPAGGPLSGVCVTDADVDTMLDPEAEVLLETQSLPHELAAADREIEAAIQDAVRHGATPRLLQLAAGYGLDAVEKHCLLVCLAPEVDLRYERIYGYLHDDLTKRRPTVGLALGLLAPEAAAKVAVRDRFLPDSRLLRNELLELCEEPGLPRPPLLGHPLRMNDRISAYLLGSDGLDRRLQSFTERIPCDGTSISGDHPLTGRIDRFLAAGESPGRGCIYLRGGYGSGARDLTLAVCARRGLSVLAVDSGRLAASPDTFEQSLLRLERECLLQPCATLFESFDVLYSDDKRCLLDAFLRSLGHHRGIIFMSGEAPWRPAGPAYPGQFVAIDLSFPGVRERAGLWASALNGEASSPGLDLVEIAARFRLTAGQISDAASTARNLAAWKGAAPSMQELYEACRLHSNQRLGSLARKIRPVHGWADLVLPPDTLDQLRELANRVRYRERVYGDWGFHRKLSGGKGLTALFSGPSGTGKTMAAAIMAAELGLELYKIDLSTVISKYIGETEKNLSRIFAEAETSNSILLFDEADALFGKRSEVRDSHDRYANIETSYLLQRLEEYEGLAILATNFRRNMDEAFVRRLQFTVEFPVPGPAERLRIWQSIWPEATPLGSDLDLDLVARRFEISGGHIRNVALAAAFMAAGDALPVGMNHLVKAARREFQKMGKLFGEATFGEWAPAFRDGPGPGRTGEAP